MAVLDLPSKLLVEVGHGQLGASEEVFDARDAAGFTQEASEIGLVLHIVIVAALGHGGFLPGGAGHSCRRRLAPSLCRWLLRPRGADAFQQHGGGFVVRVLRHQLAAEGLGEQRGRQAFDLGAGGGVAGFEAVGIGEQGFDAADDFVLFIDTRQFEFERCELLAR